MASLFIASDHAGFRLKAKLIASRSALPWNDLGPSDDARVDYPDFADLVARRIGKSATERQGALLLTDNVLREDVGVLICGSAQGMAMRANRFTKVRAAVAWNRESARLARAHNDANILCLGERMISLDEAIQALDLFLSTPFESGRHLGRVNKLSVPC